MANTGCSAVVAHLSGGQGVAGSNPVTPIVIFNQINTYCFGKET